MSINMYVINAILVLMVIRQVREHPLDLRSLAAPVLAVGAAAVLFLRSAPGGGDIMLEAACVAAGAVMGAIGGLATRLRLGADGRPLARAGALAASMWVGGVGARLAFAIAAGNGAGPAIARFSIAHHITGSAAWVAALVMMALAEVLTRLVTIYLRGRRLADGPATTAPRIRRASVPDLGSRPAAGGSYKPAPVPVAVTASGRRCGRSARSSCEGLGDDGLCMSGRREAGTVRIPRRCATRKTRPAQEHEFPGRGHEALHLRSRRAEDGGVTASRGAPAPASGRR